MTALVLLLSELARGATLQVGLDETYTSIQDAVDAAVEGDTIYVEAGTWAGFDVSTPGLTVVGEDASTTLLTSSASFHSGADGARLASFGWATTTELIPLFSEVSLSASDLAFQDLDSLDEDVEAAMYLGTEAGDIEVSLESISCSGLDRRCLFLNRTTAVIQDLVVTDLNLDDLNAVIASSSNVTLEDAQFLSLSGTTPGVALYARSSDVAVADTDFDDIQTSSETYGGAAVHAEGTTLKDGRGSLQLTDCSITDVAGAHAMLAANTIEAVDLASVSMQDAKSTDHFLQLLYVSDVALASLDLRGEANDIEVVSALLIAGAESADLADVRTENIEAEDGAFYFAGNTSLDARRIAAVDVDTPALMAVYDTDFNSARIQNVLGCSTDGSQSSSLLATQAGTSSQAEWLIEHALLTQADGPVVRAVDGVVRVQDSLFLGAPSFDDAIDWQATATDSSIAGSLVSEIDPQLGTTDRGGCELALLQPAPTSAAVDAGVGASDLDGSPSDLGILGGPEAWVFEPSDDADRDGVGWYHDCNDADASIRTCDTEEADTGATPITWAPRTGCASGTGQVAWLGWVWAVPFCLRRRRTTASTTDATHA